MGYTMIRLSVLLLLIGISTIVVIRLNIKRKALSLCCVILICAVIVSFFSVFPPENWFMHFDTPEEVFHYVKAEDWIDTIHGKKSALVLGKNRGNWDFFLVPLRNGKYLVPGISPVKQIGESYDNNRVIFLYQDKESKDVYFFGFLWGQDVPEEVCDSLGGEIQLWKDPNEKQGIKTLYFYGAVPEQSDSYYLIIDGSSITLPYIS